MKKLLSSLSGIEPEVNRSDIKKTRLGVFFMNNGVTVFLTSAFHRSNQCVRTSVPLNPE